MKHAPSLALLDMALSLTMSILFAACSGSGAHDPDGDAQDVPPDMTDAGVDVQDVQTERADTDSDSPCQEWCHADFPCVSASICDGHTRVMGCETIGCEESCGTPCCDGASCRGPLDIGVVCADGEICMERFWHEIPGVEAACRPLPSDASTDAEDDEGWRIPTSPSTCQSGAPSP